LHTPTGRKNLSIYSGSEWLPLQGVGASATYVDPVNGTDDPDKGSSSGTGAFATAQYAWDVLPRVTDANVDLVINLAAGTYSEELLLKGKYLGAGSRVVFRGAMTESSAFTIASVVVAPAKTAKGVISISGVSWTANEHRGKILKFTASTTTTSLRNQEFVIDSNTATDITFLGWKLDDNSTVAAPVAGDTFTINTFSTTIDATGGGSVLANLQQAAQQGVRFENIKFHLSGTPNNTDVSYQIQEAAAAVFKACCFEDAPILLQSFGAAELYNCYIKNVNILNSNAITQTTSRLLLDACKLHDISGTAASIGVVSSRTGFIKIRNHVDIDNFATGISVKNAGTIQFGGGETWISNYTVGIDTESNGVTENATVKVNYDGSGTDHTETDGTGVYS